VPQKAFDAVEAAVGTVPVQRSGMKNAASRSGHGTHVIPKRKAAGRTNPESRCELGIAMCSKIPGSRELRSPAPE
jgi:hypothetical protein